MSAFVKKLALRLSAYFGWGLLLSAVIFSVYLTFDSYLSIQEQMEDFKAQDALILQSLGELNKWRNELDIAAVCANQLRTYWLPAK